MPTRTFEETFVHPETGHKVATDVPASKTTLKAHGYVPEDHPLAKQTSPTQPSSSVQSSSSAQSSGSSGASSSSK